MSSGGRDLPSPSRGEGGLGRRPSRERGARPARSSPASLRAPLSPLQGQSKLDLVLLGEFGRAHGLKGEVRVKSFTAEPAAIAGYGPLRGEDGRIFALSAVRPAGGSPDMLIGRVEGVATREAADALNRTRLYASRDQLPPPEEEDEFFAADLIGLAVTDMNGVVLGQVVAVPNYGGGDLIEIRPSAGGPSALLPFTKAFVPAVDLAARQVTVDPPADLFSANGDERAKS